MSRVGGPSGLQIQRSGSGGGTWESLGTMPARVWHLAASLVDPDTVYAASEDAALLRSTDAGERWDELPGLRQHGIGAPMKSEAEDFPLDGKLRVYRSRSGGAKWEPLTTGLPQRDCYVSVPRSALAADTIAPCGLYFGTTGGAVYGSNDGGDSWTPIVRDLPPVNSVEVQTMA